MSFVYKNCPQSNDQIVVTWVIPENLNELLIEVKYLNDSGGIKGLNKYFNGGLKLEFGKNVFVFDKDSCDFLKRR